MLDYKELKTSSEKGDLMSYYVLFSESFRQAYCIALGAMKKDADARELLSDAYLLSFCNLSKLSNPAGFQIWINHLTAYDAAYVLGREDALSFIPKEDELSAWAETFPVAGNVTAAVWKLFNEKLAAYNAAKRKAERVRSAAERNAGLSAAGTSPSAADASALAAERGISDADIETINLKAGPADAQAKKARRLKLVISGLVAGCLIIGAIALGERLAPSKKNGTAERTPISSEKVLKIADVLSGQLSGRIGEVYQISDDIYYLVIYVGGEPAGVLASYDAESGEIKLLSENPAPTDGSVSEGKSSKTDGGYLHLQFSGSGATGGVQGNVEYILENAIAGSGEKTVSSEDNKIKVDGDLLSGMDENAAREKDGMQDFFGLSEEDLSIILRIRCLDVDLSKPVVLSFDPGISALIGDAGSLQIIMGDDRYAVSVSRQQLEKLCAEGGLTLSVYEKGGASFEILFYDQAGQLLGGLPSELTLTLPAESRLAYVKAMLWDAQSEATVGPVLVSGSYDTVLKTLSFPVSEPGMYALTADILDKNESESLSDEEKLAVDFAVRCGMIKLGSDGMFRPYEALDPDDCSFAAAASYLGVQAGDVPVLPSSEKTVSREVFLSACGKLLSVYSGEAYPKNSQDYLGFSDRAEISADCYPSLALLSKCGVLGTVQGQRLDPRSSITRKDAAVFMYRCFCTGE